MKVNNKIRRITSVCAVAALVFIVSMFPITASADSVEDFNLSLSYNIMQMPEQNISISVSKNISNKSAYLVSHEAIDDVPMDYLTLLRFSADIVNSTSSVIIKAGETFDISLSGIHLGLGVNDSPFVWKQTPSFMYFQVYYNDGTFTRLNELNFTYSSLTETQAIACTSVAEKDIYRIVFYEEIPQYSVTNMHGLFPVDIWMGDTVTPTYLQVDIQSKEAGLLGDMVNGTPEQNQQAQDVVGGLNSSTDKLGQLGDTMASVEKPTIDSNKISAGSLVPSTSLVVLSSPFQALWENNQLLAMLTIVVTLVLVSWVFFGKKG